MSADLTISRRDHHADEHIRRTTTDAAAVASSRHGRTGRQPGVAASRSGHQHHNGTTHTNESIPAACEPTGRRQHTPGVHPLDTTGTRSGVCCGSRWLTPEMFGNLRAR